MKVASLRYVKQMDFPTLAKSAAEALEEYAVLSDKDLQLMKNLMSFTAVKQHFSAWTSAIKERGYTYNPTFVTWYCYGSNLKGADPPYPYPLEKQGYAIHYASERALNHFREDDPAQQVFSVSRNEDEYTVDYYNGHMLDVTYKADGISISRRNSPFTGDYVPETGLFVECEKLSVHVSPDGSVKVTPAK